MMSLIEEHLGPIAIKQWRRFRAKSFLREVDKRSKFGTEELLGLSGTRGVLKRSELESRSAQAENYAGYKLVKPGDLVSNKMQAWNGIFGISSFHGMTSPDYAVYEFHKPCVNRFFEYLFTTLLYATDFKARSNGIGTGFMRLNPSEFLRTNIWIPDIKIQNAIVDFIDSKTSRIDALITKKTRFIELLKEKRQAVITKAVTKGLDDSVEMKDSRIPWMGAIPAHWRAVPSNWLFLEIKDRSQPDDQHLSASQKHGVIPLSEFERLEGRRVTHAEKNLDQRKHVEVGDFVISMRSFQGGIEIVKARGCVRSSYVALRAGASVDSRFFSYLFKSSAYIQGLQSTATFIRDGQDLSYANFRQVKLPLLCMDEQVRIASYLNRVVSRIDVLVSKTERSIELLKEHRSALITAAVTGKIDVREAA